MRKCWPILIIFFFRQVEDASEIASIAQQAYEISSDAYEMARQALEQQHFTANQVSILPLVVTENIYDWPYLTPMSNLVALLSILSCLKLILETVI